MPVAWQLWPGISPLAQYMQAKLRCYQLNWTIRLKCINAWLA